MNPLTSRNSKLLLKNRRPPKHNEKNAGDVLASPAMVDQGKLFATNRLKIRIGFIAVFANIQTFNFLFLGHTHTHD